MSWDDCRPKGEGLVFFEQGFVAYHDLATEDQHGYLTIIFWKLYSKQAYFM